jgi:hypothetical protein
MRRREFIALAARRLADCYSRPTVGPHARVGGIEPGLLWHHLASGHLADSVITTRLISR